MVSIDSKVLNRLKRAEGQLRGVQGMIEQEKSCEEVVTQLTAVRSSIDRIIGIIVAENLRECLSQPDADSQAQAEKIDKAINLIVKK